MRSPTAGRMINAILAHDHSTLDHLLRLPHITKDATEALGFASSLGRLECVQLLLPYSQPMNNSCRALDMAAAKGHTECVRALLPFSNPNARKGEALALAAQNDHVQCVQALLPDTDPQWHSNALFLASIHQRRECVKILLKLSCCAQELLNELKTMYSSDGAKWRVLEEELQAKNIASALPSIHGSHKRKI